ncbi:hypothetical protein CPB86DRAFT_635860 [Serendipita vermifera]|nr:hypothetical protein CPB86DRAFT_635860 [Serendipita vermifera]
MKGFSPVAVSFFLLSWLVAFITARVDGPFFLYTKSSDPAWNLRFLNVAARNAYLAINDAVSSPANIPSANSNFFINTTATLTPDAPYGQLVWGAQSYYSNLFARVDIIDPSSPIQPIFHDISYALQGYSTHWNFTADKQLLLDGKGDRFYATVLNTDRYNYPTVHWLFGSKTQTINAVPITIWRYP